MDNPAYFTVLWRADGTDWNFTDAGLLGSIRSASDAAGKILANTDIPDLDLAVAVVTMLDQDPATGTPLGHLDPRNAAGYALGSISVADPERRGLGQRIHPDFATALAIARAARSRNRASENDAVLDVVALSIVEPTMTTTVRTELES